MKEFFRSDASGIALAFILLVISTVAILGTMYAWNKFTENPQEGPSRFATWTLSSNETGRCYEAVHDTAYHRPASIFEIDCELINATH